MYLTKIILNTKDNYVLNCILDVDRMHKLVMSGFDDFGSTAVRKQIGVLYQMSTKGDVCSLIIQSDIIPDYRKLNNKIIDYSTKDMSNFLNSISDGQRLYLNVLSEPYKKVSNLNSKNSRRKVLTDYNEKAEWFNKKISRSCNIIREDVETPTIRIFGKKATGKFIYRPSQYKCLVEVTDRTEFLKTVHDGIGSGKSYGMGMIQIFK